MEMDTCKVNSMTLDEWIGWYIPSPREDLVGHHFLSYPEEKKEGVKVELVQQYMQDSGS